MIHNVSIRHFKSIRQLDFACKRINLFIGEPNVGKSNVLEALGLFSARYARNIGDFVRMKDMTNLFFDSDTTAFIEVKIDRESLVLRVKSGRNGSDDFSVGASQQLNDSMGRQLFHHLVSTPGVVAYNEIAPDYQARSGIDFVRYYKFKTIQDFSSSPYPFLDPPSGTNLFDVLFKNKHLRELVAGIIKDKGYRLNLEVGSKEIKLMKEVGDIIYTYPYQSVSDTLQRIIFYLAAIETNQDSVLILEEPEANTFPFYTKYLGEIIAQDESNQYFIATHNPYLLLSLVEKTKMSEVAVFIAYLENYETKLRPLAEEELSELMDLNTDVFFNFDKFLSK